MSSQTEIMEILQKAASKLNVPLRFEKNGSLFVSQMSLNVESKEKKREKDLFAVQRIEIEEQSVKAVCSIQLIGELNPGVLNLVNFALGKDSEFSYTYDTDKKTLYAGRSYTFEQIKKYPGEKFCSFIDWLLPKAKDLNPYKCLFASPIFNIRLLYDSYMNALHSDICAADAVKAAQKVLDKDGISYTYRYNIIRELMEEKGARYIVEHMRLRDEFNKAPESMVDSIIKGGKDCAISLLKTLEDRDDIIHIPDYDGLETDIPDIGQGKKCVHIFIPNSKPEYDSTDIMLVSAPIDALYYSIMIRNGETPEEPPVYSLAGWDKDLNQYDFGWYATRKAALDQFVKMMREK